MINKYICTKCGNIGIFEEGDGKGYVTSWQCRKCGHINDIADMSQLINRVVHVSNNHKKYKYL